MSTPRCYVLLAVFLLGAWVCAAPTMENAAPPAQEETRSAEIDQELALFRDHLLNNKDFATRVSAATVLLFKEAPAARELVIEALTQSDNATARAAVCKALDASRTDPRQLKNAEDFLLPLIGVLRTSEDGNIATLAAEATLMFSYDQVQSELEKIVDDGQLPATIRSNAVYALQLHPDKRAALKLISLLDSPDGTLGHARPSASFSSRGPKRTCASGWSAARPTFANSAPSWARGSSIILPRFATGTTRLATRRPAATFWPSVSRPASRRSSSGPSTGWRN